MKLAEIRKAVVPAVGLLAQVVALGVLHGTALEVASAVLWAAAVAGVYGVPNAPKTTPAAPKDAGVTLVELLIIATLVLVVILVFVGPLH
jgi:hypothetical protein